MSNEDTDTTTVELSTETAQRLQNREQPGDEGCDDVIRRLLDATETVLSMEDAAQRIRDAYDDLFAVMIDSSSFHREDGSEALHITAFVSHSEYEDSPSLFDDVQRIELGGVERRFVFVHCCDPPESGRHVPLYWEEVPTVEPKSVEEGVEQAARYLQDRENVTANRNPRWYLSDPR